MSLEIQTIEDFEYLTQSKELVVIHFWAEWNGYDKLLKEILNGLAVEFEEKVKFCSLDVDQQQFIGFLRSLPLPNIPALAYYKDGNKIALEIGLRKKKYIQNKIENYLNLR